MSQFFTSPNSWGYFISNRYGWFGDVTQISNSWDINPHPQRNPSNIRWFIISTPFWGLLLDAWETPSSSPLNNYWIGNFWIPRSLRTAPSVHHWIGISPLNRINSCPISGPAEPADLAQPFRLQGLQRQNLRQLLEASQQLAKGNDALPQREGHMLRGPTSPMEKSMVVDDLWWFMVIFGDCWWFYDDCMMILWWCYDDLWWFMVIYCDLWWFVVIYDYLWWFMISIYKWGYPKNGWFISRIIPHKETSNYAWWWMIYDDSWQLRLVDSDSSWFIYRSIWLKHDW